MNTDFCTCGAGDTDEKRFNGCTRIFAVTPGLTRCLSLSLLYFDLLFEFKYFLTARQGLREGHGGNLRIQELSFLPL